MFCSEWSLVKLENKLLTAIPLRCKCWTCYDCAPLRKKRLINECLAGAPDLFITLTSKRIPGGDPDQAAQQLVKAWRTVRARYIKAHGKSSLPFMAVFEATKNGWPHLHIVARCKWLDQGWLSQQMDALIQSPIVDVRRIKNTNKMVNYITKYCGKNPHRFQGVKRYWRSLAFIKPAPEEEEVYDEHNTKWIIVEEYFKRIRDTWALPIRLTPKAYNSMRRYYGIPP